VPGQHGLADAAAEWFRGHRRDLPWRRPGTSAWAILISEMMLQQTPVVRVVPAWLTWLERWPTPADLAGASPADVLRAWDRLGYPRRALRLRECAAAIVQRHDGVVPADVAQLLALPGIGGYTARAVAVFAYRQRHPVVDTNVRRVLARAVNGQPDAGPVTTAADLALAESQLPGDPELAAQASAAFMEIGAVVCVARSPRCDECPLARACRWRAVGRELPPGPSRRPQRYAGTDRQVRGRVMAALRASDAALTRAQIDLLWPNQTQLDRALATLVDDGLVQAHGESYALPIR
jgi:A/G-specific adenine glycosylase